MADRIHVEITGDAGDLSAAAAQAAASIKGIPDEGTKAARRLEGDNDRAGRSFDRLRARVRQTRAELGRGLRGRAQVDADTGGIDRFLGRLRRARAEVARRVTSRIELRGDTSGIDQFLGRLRRARAEVGRRVQSRIDIRGDTGGIARFLGVLRRTRAEARQSIRVHTDTSQAQQALGGLDGVIGRVNTRFTFLRNHIGLLRWPVLVTGAGLAVGVLSQLSGGAAGAGNALGALAQGFAVARFATGGLGKALGGLWEKLDTNAKAFKQLSPEGQRFARTLQDFKAPIRELQQTTQRGLFPGLEDGLKAAVRNLPVVDRIVSRTSRMLGSLGAQAGRALGGRAWGRDLETLGNRNVVVLGRMGRSAGHLASALRHVSVAAGPLTGWMARGVERFAQSLEQAAEKGRRTGDMARYFREIRPLIAETARLGVDLARSFFRLGRNPALAGMVRQLRAEALPAVEKLLGALSTHAGPELIELFANLARLGAVLAPHIGKIVGLLARLAGWLADLAAKNPAVASLAAGFLTLGSAVGALKFIGTITGLRTILGLLGKLRGARMPPVLGGPGGKGGTGPGGPVVAPMPDGGKAGKSWGQKFAAGAKFALKATGVGLVLLEAVHMMKRAHADLAAQDRRVSAQMDAQRRRQLGDWGRLAGRQGAVWKRLNTDALRAAVQTGGSFKRIQAQWAAGFGALARSAQGKRIVLRIHSIGDRQVRATLMNLARTRLGRKLLQIFERGGRPAWNLLTRLTRSRLGPKILQILERGGPAAFRQLQRLVRSPRQMQKLMRILQRGGPEAYRELARLLRIKLPLKKQQVIERGSARARAAVRAVAAVKLPPKTARVHAETNRALSAISQVKAVLGSLRDKNVNVTVNRRYTGAKAQSGYWRGGLVAGFAAGGIGEGDPVTDPGVHRDAARRAAGRVGEGGMFRRPTYMVGEESRPEVVIAGNPAYRKDNLRYWAMAGRMLGVPGFAYGGYTNLPDSVRLNTPIPGPAPPGYTWAEDRSLVPQSFYGSSGGGGSGVVAGLTIGFARGGNAARRRAQQRRLRARQRRWLKKELRWAGQPLRGLARDPLRKIEDLERAYGQQERLHGISEEEYVRGEDPPKLSMPDINRRINELNDLMARKLRIRDWLEERVKRAKAAVRGYTRAVNRVKDSLSRSSVRSNRQRLKDRLSQYRQRLGDWKEIARDAPFAVRDNEIDRVELRKEITSLSPANRKKLLEQAGGAASAAAAGAGDQSSERADVLAELVGQWRRGFAVSQGQYGVLRDFGSQYLGSHARGLREVSADGIVEAHRGEMIAPNPDGPWGNALRPHVTAQSGSTQVAVYIEGDQGALIRSIRAEVDGRAADVVRRDLGKKSRRIASAPGSSLPRR